MLDVRAVEVKPITDADIQAVAEFLHLDMGSAVSAADWHQAMTPPWDVEQPNHGYLLRENGRVVGVENVPQRRSAARTDRLPLQRATCFKWIGVGLRSAT